MNLDEALKVADEAVFNNTGNYLTDIQKCILQECWDNKSYDEIAEKYHKTSQHFKNEGNKLWKLLTDALGEKVSKSSFRAGLERYQRRLHNKPVFSEMENHAQNPVIVNKVKYVDEHEIEQLSDIPVIGDEASEVGVDYTELRKYLNHQEFRKADLETARLMLRVARREQEGFFELKDVQNFPVLDLATINKLWLYGSKGRFGFSVQKQILMGLKQVDNPNYLKSFIKTLEWEKENRIVFELRAVKGHLPIGIYVKLSDNAKLHQKWWAAMDIYLQEEMRRMEEERQRQKRRRRYVRLRRPGESNPLVGDSPEKRWTMREDRDEVEGMKMYKLFLECINFD